MKKILYFSFAVLFTALFVSCNKEINNSELKDNEPLKVTIIAGNPSPETGTKTEIYSGDPYWSVGDQIGVSDGESSNSSFTTSIVARSTTAEFTGTVASVGDYYAYYPFTSNGVAEVPSSSGIYGAKVDLPANQYPTVTSFDGSADIMLSKKFSVAAVNPTIGDLQFARLGAIIKVVLVDTESLLTDQHPSTVALTADSDLVGRVLINMKEQCLGDIYYNGSHTVTANYTSLTKYLINGSNATYLIVAPQLLAAGSTLTVTASTEGYSIEKEITIPAGGINLQAGKITTLNISLTSAHVTASSGAALPFNDDMSWADNGGSDNNTDIGSTISTESGGLYTTGSKAYKGIGGIKLGTSSINGSITTKELDLSGGFHIAVEGAVYGTDTGNLVVTVDETEVINEAFGAVNYVNIASGTYTNKSKVTIATSAKRGRIYSVSIASGDYVYVAPPVINVTSDNPMAVANTASSQTINYTIANPTGASITAVLQNPSDTWISNIDYSSEGVITFDVAAQENEAAARSAVIVLSYSGASSVNVTVNQAAGPSSKTLVYTFTPAQAAGNNAYGSTYDVTIGGVSWNAPGNQNFSGYWRIGGKNISEAARIIYGNGSITGDVDEIVISTNGVSNTGLTVNSITVTVHSSSSDAQNNTNVYATFTTTDSFTFSKNTAKNLTFNKVGTSDCNGKYYRITFTVTNSDTKNNYGIDLTGMTFYKN